MKSKNARMSLGLIASLMGGLPATAIAEDDVAMPAIVLPAEDMAEAPGISTESGVEPGDALIAMIREQIAQRYLGTGEVDLDQDRLGKLLSGQYLSDYKSTQARDPVAFSNSVFQPREKLQPQADVQQPAAAATPEMGEFSLTPDAIRAMSSMSRDQIEAIALMFQILQDPENAKISSQSALKAIPALSDEDIEGQSPEQILAALTQPRHKEVPRVVDVGNGRDIALENWEVIVSPSGSAELSNSAIPGSRFSVEPNMIVGQFGRVTDVSIEPGNVFVEFETGDRVEEKSAPLGQGIPAIDENYTEDRSRYGGEILVSGDLPANTSAEASISKHAVLSSLRPVARPAYMAPKAPASADLANGAPGHPDRDDRATTVPEKTALFAISPRPRPDLSVTPGKSVPEPANLLLIKVSSPIAPETSNRPQPKPSRL